VVACFIKKLYNGYEGGNETLFLFRRDVIYINNKIISINLMNKKIISLLSAIGLLFSVNFASAQKISINNPLKHNSIGDLLLNGIIPAVAGIVGALSVIMIIVAGILYLTSAGSPEKMTKAKTALMYAIAGIVITMIAEAIVVTIRSALGA